MKYCKKLHVAGSATQTDVREISAVGECCISRCAGRRSDTPRPIKMLLAASLVLVLITWHLILSATERRVSLFN